SIERATNGRPGCLGSICARVTSCLDGALYGCYSRAANVAAGFGYTADNTFGRTLNSFNYIATYFRYTLNSTAHRAGCCIGNGCAYLSYALDSTTGYRCD